jgi:hypothetical protein
MENQDHRRRDKFLSGSLESLTDLDIKYSISLSNLAGSNLTEPIANMIILHHLIFLRTGTYCFARRVMLMPLTIVARSPGLA